MITAKLLHQMVNACSDGIVVAEQEGEDDCILVYANPAFSTLTGYPNEEILYRDCRFLQGKDRQQPAQELIRKAIREGKPCREVLRNYRKDGSEFWNELSITPVRNEANQLMYYIGVQKDVTEQVQNRARIQALESQVSELRARLEQLQK